MFLQTLLLALLNPSRQSENEVVLLVFVVHIEEANGFGRESSKQGDGLFVQKD